MARRKDKPASPVVSPRQTQPAPGYPADHCEHRSAEVNASRRRFLRQVAAGSGAVGLVSSSFGLVKAQPAPETDFSILEEHQAAPAAPEMRSEEPRRRARGSGGGPPSGDPADDAEAATAVGAEEVWVTENRALWVEPGYLLLLRWRRPETDGQAIAALEASTDSVSSYLTGAVTDPATQLHSPDSLGDLEEHVVAMLSEAVAPATIEVLHLDHDCQIVCPAPEIEHPMVRGRIAPTRR